MDPARRQRRLRDHEAEPQMVERQPLEVLGEAAEDQVRSLGRAASSVTAVVAHRHALTEIGWAVLVPEFGQMEIAQW